MKLRRIIAENKTYFHGTTSTDFIKNGLEFGKDKDGISPNRSAVYVGSLKQALAYGNIIYEINLDGLPTTTDEDALLYIADPDDPNWVDQVKNLPPNQRKALHKAAMQEGGWESGRSKMSLADFIEKYKLYVENESDNTAGNLRIESNVSPDKIVAVYQMQKLDHNKYGDSNYKVINIPYSVTPSLQIGDIVIGSNEKTF